MDLCIFTITLFTSRKYLDKDFIGNYNTKTLIEKLK